MAIQPHPVLTERVTFSTLKHRQPDGGKHYHGVITVHKREGGHLERTFRQRIHRETDAKLYAEIVVKRYRLAWFRRTERQLKMRMAARKTLHGWLLFWIAQLIGKVRMRLGADRPWKVEKRMVVAFEEIGRRKMDGLKP